MATRFILGLVALCLACHADPVQGDPVGHATSIVIDGDFGDWRATLPALIDPADAPDAAVDFGEIRISHNARFVSLLIDFGRTVNAQGLDGTAMILLDVDGDPATGTSEFGMRGVDLIVDLTPHNEKNPDKPGMGMAIRCPAQSADPPGNAVHPPTVYDIGLNFAPTHAGRRMEFRLNRNVKLPDTPPLFSGASFSGKLVFIDLSGHVADETDEFHHELSAQPDAALLPADARDPLARLPATQIRIMSWNVERGAMFKNPKPFARTMAAVNPDVILLQELTDKNTVDQVRDFLTAALPPHDGESWSVIIGEGGGDLRCAVASRFSLQPVESLRLIPFPDRPERTARAAGAIVECNGRRLLALSVHLRCCGRAGGSEDQQRILEARVLNDAVKSAAQTQPIDGIIISGDFNLVGSRDPVELIAAGADLDASTLTIVPAYQLDGLSNATWADPKQPFAPGRLDYMLYSDSDLELTESFVYDSSDLAEAWLKRHLVQPADSSAASDHLPLIADFHWPGR